MFLDVFEHLDFSNSENIFCTNMVLNGPPSLSPSPASAKEEIQQRRQAQSRPGEKEAPNIMLTEK